MVVEKLLLKAAAPKSKPCTKTLFFLLILNQKGSNPEIQSQTTTLKFIFIYKSSILKFFTLLNSCSSSLYFKESNIYTKKRRSKNM
jgi:hypothetical protein